MPVFGQAGGGVTFTGLNNPEVIMRRPCGFAGPDAGAERGDSRPHSGRLPPLIFGAYVSLRFAKAPLTRSGVTRSIYFMRKGRAEGRRQVPRSILGGFNPEVWSESLRDGEDRSSLKALSFRRVPEPT